MVEPTVDKSDNLSENYSDLVTLNDIFRMKKQPSKDNVIESYIMLHAGIEKQAEFSSVTYDLSLIVKRTKLIFNDKECIVFNFQDISAIKKLKREEEKTRLMTLLYSSVHHEIIGPLENNIEASERLIKLVNDKAQRDLAQIILICSK